VTTEPSIAFCAALVDALASQGVSHAAVSPGSRNTPLLLALAAHPAVAVSVHHDERSGAFFALGLAKATGRPAVVACTSGTAATEYLPAMTEARMSHVPLIALTADRPPELQDRGAPQTINQTNLYGVAAKWFHDCGAPNEESIANAAHLGRQAVATALESPAGPVHLNIPLREPLVPANRERRPPPGAAGRPATVVRRAAADETEIRAIADLVSGRPTLIIAGPSASPGLGAAVSEVARALQGVVMADPQSAARFSSPDDRALISAADLLVASGFRGTTPPGAIIHVGAIHSSKVINDWLQDLGVDLVHIDSGQWHDPLRIATSVVAADPALTLGLLAKVVTPAPPAFAASWRAADDAATEALSGSLTGIDEPSIARAVVESVPSGGVLVAGSSMPIRLVDSYGVRRSRPLTLIANRGANGIDGAIATALGVASAQAGPTYALLGDLTALVDVGSLATASRLGVPVTIVVINNDGGGIFEFLPQADPARIDPDVFREFIRAPHGRRLAAIAGAFDVEATTVTDRATLVSLVEEVPTRPRLIEVHTDGAAGPGHRLAAIELVNRAIRSR